MEPDWHGAALVAAGVIGIVVAVVHGVLIHRLIGRPLAETTRRSPVLQRLGPPLLQFSTYNWFLGGAALIASAAFTQDARLAVGILVASSYLFGAAGNLWATRGRHPGWAAYTLALGLIVYGLT